MSNSKADTRGRVGACRSAPLRRAALCAAILACAAGTHLQAQQETLYTANYRDADIRMVAEQVQAVIGRTIIIDPRVRAQVTVLSNAPMTADAFYRTFLASLEVHGFVALDSGSAIQIVPDSNARFGARMGARMGAHWVRVTARPSRGLAGAGSAEEHVDEVACEFLTARHPWNRQPIADDPAQHLRREHE